MEITIGEKYIVHQVNYQYHSWCEPGYIIEVVRPIISGHSGQVLMWDIKCHNGVGEALGGTFRVGEFFFDGCNPYYRDKNLDKLLS